MLATGNMARVWQLGILGARGRWSSDSDMSVLGLGHISIYDDNENEIRDGDLHATSFSWCWNKVVRLRRASW